MRSLESVLRAEVAEWGDDSRMRGLFSQLPRSRHHNAAAWDDKIAFWRRVLALGLRHGLLGARSSAAASLSSSSSPSLRSSPPALPVLIATEHGTTPSRLALDVRMESGSDCLLEWEFVRDGLRPRCIAGVVVRGITVCTKCVCLCVYELAARSQRELVRTDRSLVDVDTYFFQLGSSSATHGRSLAAALALRTLDTMWWTTRTLFGAVAPLIPQPMRLFGAGTPQPDTPVPSGRYVYMPAVQEVAAHLASTLIAAAQSSEHWTGRLLTVDQFRDRFLAPTWHTLFGADAQISGEDARIVLHCLHNLHLVSLDPATDARGAARVKIVSTPAEAPWTTEERDFVQLLQSRLAVQRHVDQLHVRIDSLEAEARTLIARGRRQAAMAALKLKQSASRTLTQRLEALCTLDEIIFRIQQAQTDKEIVAALQVGAKALDATLTAGPSVDAVETLMDQVSDTLADARLVDQTLAAGVQSVTLSTDAEVEAELDALLAAQELEAQADREQRDLERAEAMLSTMPAVPAAHPAVSEEAGTVDVQRSAPKEEKQQALEAE